MTGINNIVTHNVKSNKSKRLLTTLINVKCINKTVKYCGKL